MIADTLDQCRRYTTLSPGFAAAFDFLQKLPADHPPGRYPLDGDRCYALVQSYTTKPLAEARFEAHRQFIDIQFIQSGCETILWSPLAALTETIQPYCAERDVEFFANPRHVKPIHLHAGEFAIFFPEDGHAPLLECGGPCGVRKAVMKIRVHG